MYIMRLDDASEHMNISKWIRMEKLLDKYSIKPIYGIIPNNQDSELLKYDKVENFWKLMNDWKDKGWTPALHGYTHVFETNEGGINPVNNRSEFAGVELNKQCEKISLGYKKLIENGIYPDIFFAPAHTFDENTLKALIEESNIRIISDTVANDVYYENDFYFVPQQSGRCRKLPFKMTTFCYHPNTMTDNHFKELENFLKVYYRNFIQFQTKLVKKRKLNIYDYFLQKIYFVRRK